MRTRRDRTPHAAWIVWGVSLCVYALGTFHRSSLAVAGLHATERFGISATQLGSFVMLQLAIYALLQIPVGVLVDRFGARRVLLLGVAAMSVGQVIFALTDSYLVAVLARVLVGVGDSSTFVCVLRLITSWFPPARMPMLTQLTGPVGQIGSMAAAVPMIWSLDRYGWERPYLSVGALGFVLALIVLTVVRDAPGRRRLIGAPMSVRAIRRSLTSSWSEPGTRIGFWIHFSQHFSASALGLLWGFPFFVQGEGTSQETAALLITVMTVSMISMGPILGWFVARRARWRSELALGSIGLVAITWTLVLVWSGPAPVWLLLTLVVVVGASGPVAMVGFDYARQANPPERLASAVGIVNQGGFVASLSMVMIVGVLLDLSSGAGPGGVRSAGSFTLAFSAQFVLWGLAATQIWRLRGRIGSAVDVASCDSPTGPSTPADTM